MTDAITIGHDTRINHWTVAALDGRRAVCRCRCGNVRIISVAALKSGESTSCGCMPVSSERAASMRAEAEEQKRQRDLRRWRPTPGE
jgi:hypothetical protein